MYIEASWGAEVDDADRATGSQGDQGFPGPSGAQGMPGPEGPPGPPFGNAVIDRVGTLDPGESATVSVFFDGTNVRFTFGLPRGADGQAGPEGAQGPAGPQGPAGASLVNAQVDSVATLNPDAD